MALTQTQVSQLYVVLFGRASEGSGNKNVMNAYSNMTEAANEMLKHEAVAVYFGGELTDEQFVTFIYENTFGFTPNAEDLANNLALIEGGMSRGELVANLIETAMSEEYAGTDAQNLFINKVNVSNYVANTLENLDASRVNELAFKSSQKDGALNVTADKASVEAAKKAVDSIVAGSISGKVEYLTVGSDKLEGTDGDDLFIARVEQNGNGNESNTLGSGDVINGKGGNDTLKAEIVTAYNIASKTKDIKPVTVDVENIEITVQSNDEINSTATIDAANMNGVKKISSIGSNGDLLVKNMMGSNNVVDKNGFVTEKVYGGTENQTVEFAYSGNADTNWKQADMTVYYDQDYLTRSEDAQNGVDIVLMDLYENKKNKHPVASFDKITINLNGKGSVDVPITDEIQALSGKEAYEAIVKAMNDKFDAEGWNVKASILDAEEAIFSTNIGDYKKGETAGDYYPIRLVNSGEEKFGEITIVSDTNVGKGNRLENYTPIPESKFDTPVSINVDLEKVGLAADGGALVIGSMNKDTKNHDNKYGLEADGKSKGFGQGITTTDTVAGFDEFNVTVKGDKSKNSSLSSLHSTNNSLRKVTIDSVGEGNANLTIGNSNTFGTYATNEAAFKDVQIMDASKFNGDLVLNAGFTKEIVAKYLANAEETTLYGLNNPAKELALFEYKGGKGDDVLNLAFDLDDIVKENFVATTNDTNGLNVFKMNIDGGAGNDDIIITTDAVTAGDSMTNMTINGGAGNDYIELDVANHNKWSFNVAFDGNHFGHDTIVAFDTGAVTLTNEAQTLNLDGFVAHKDEVIVVTVGNVETTFKATVGMDDAAIAGQVALMLAGTTPGFAATQKFTTATAAAEKITLAKTGENVNSVTVEIQKHVEVAGTFDKDMEVIHSAVSETQAQGGLLKGANGADTLDFSAYNVKTVKINNTDVLGETIVSTSTSKVGYIDLVTSKHDAEVYNAYYNDGNTTIEIGSIRVKDEDGGAIDLADSINGLDASQFLI